ncbi:MAG: hypothetical protein Kow0089_06710 [Desulfobulbaceae bacterium]
MKFPGKDMVGAVSALPRKVRSLPLLLYSYVANEMLAPFFASFLILYGVFFLVRLVPLLDVVLDLKIGFADFIRMFSYIFPHMLVYVIPMASMIGVVLAFTRLSYDREILAFKACGVGLRQMLPPVIFIAACISLLTAFFSIQLIPAGNVAMKHLLFQLARERIEKGIQERTFTEALGDLVVYVDKVDERQNWEGVYISDMRNRKQPIIIMARKGNLIPDLENMIVTIVLGDGTIHNTSGTENQTVRFGRYQLNIPIPNPTRVHGDDVTVLDRSSMTQKQLLASAEERGGATREGVIFLTEYHERLVLPVGCFILSILGIPLGLQAGPGRRAVGIPLGLGFFVLYYVMTTFGTILAEDLEVSVPVGMWAPNVILALITFYIFHRVDRERPIISPRIQSFFYSVHTRTLQPVLEGGARGFHRLLRWRPGQEDELAAGEQDTLEIRASVHERVYHYPGCALYECEDCTLLFKSGEVAREAGFRPCDQCCRAEDVI